MTTGGTVTASIVVSRPWQSGGRRETLLVWRLALYHIVSSDAGLSAITRASLGLLEFMQLTHDLSQAKSGIEQSRAELL